MGITGSLVYCFFGGVGESRDEHDQHGVSTILVMHDDSVDTMWAMIVSQKGVREEVVDGIIHKLEFAGHAGAEITIRSDQEEAVMA